jgi:hypothetical protein
MDNSWLNSIRHERTPARKKERNCVMCGEFMIANTTVCNPCRYKRAKAKKNFNNYQFEEEQNPLAYQFVFRNEETAQLYKGNEIPDGHKLIYKSKPGFLLPETYKDLEEYEQKLDSQ